MLVGLVLFCPKEFAKLEVSVFVLHSYLPALFINLILTNDSQRENLQGTANSAMKLYYFFHRETAEINYILTTFNTNVLFNSF